MQSIPLSKNQSAKIISHLLALDEESSFARFNQFMKKDGIIAYIQNKNFDSSKFLGIFHQDVIIGLAEIDISKNNAELSFSVLPKFQDRGIGNALFEDSLEYARSLGIHDIFLTISQSNKKMKNLALEQGMIVENPWDSEISGWIPLAPMSLKEKMVYKNELFYVYIKESQKSWKNFILSFFPFYLINNQ
ncbi:MAG TPA: GNAT family N-acetyltransferase [Ignavibacteriaceae bacterium]